MAVCAGCVLRRTVVALRAEQGWCARCICAHGLHLSAIEVQPEPLQENWLTIEDMRTLLARDEDTTFVFPNSSPPPAPFKESRGVDEDRMVLCLHSSQIRHDKYRQGGEFYGIQMILYAATKQFVPFHTIIAEMDSVHDDGQALQASLRQDMQYLKSKYNIGGDTYLVCMRGRVSKEAQKEEFERNEYGLLRWLWAHFRTENPLPVLGWHNLDTIVIYGVREGEFKAEILYTAANLTEFKFDFTRPVLNANFPQFDTLIRWNAPYEALEFFDGYFRLYGPVMDAPLKDPF